MTENYREFLHWATTRLTVNQYHMLTKIIYSFKKYKETDEPGIYDECHFKDDEVLVRTHFPQFFAEMADLAGYSLNDFFITWYNDNVIFWPYKERPDLVEARQRLMKKCERRDTPYRFLYVFRENQHGEITCFNIVNKYFAGSPLHRWGLETYINTLWFKPVLKNTHMAPRDYTREHNTKKILKHCLGFSNKQYKELVNKYPRKPNLNLSSYQASVYSYFVKVYNQLIDIPIDTLYLPYLYYKYVSDEHGINPEGSTFISDIIVGIAELKERGELK